MKVACNNLEKKLGDSVISKENLLSHRYVEELESSNLKNYIKYGGN